MNFLEIIRITISTIVNKMVEIMPISIIDLLIFAIGAIIVESLSRLVLFFVWERNLFNISSDLVEKNMYKEFTKKLCLDISEKDYFDKHNNLKIEATYFTITTLIIFLGLYLENTFLIGLFFIVRTSRNIITNLKINLNAIDKVKCKVFDEKEIYCNICISDEYQFSNFFESSEPGLSEELSVLELKFKELVRRNKIDKELAFNLLNSRKIDSTIKDLINNRYSEMISTK